MDLSKPNNGLSDDQFIHPDDLYKQRYFKLQEQFGKMRRCIALLNSMILSGEQHSELSKKIVCDALNKK